MEKNILKFDKANIFIGFVFLLICCLPISYQIIDLIPGFDHGIEKYFSWPNKSLIKSFIRFSINFSLIYYIFIKIRVFSRLSSDYYTPSLFIWGNIIFIISYVMGNLWIFFPKNHLFSIALNNSHYLEIIAKLILLIACSKVLLGIEPMPEKCEESS